MTSTIRWPRRRRLHHPGPVTRQRRQGLHCPDCDQDGRVEMDVIAHTGRVVATLQGCEVCRTGLAAQP